MEKDEYLEIGDDKYLTLNQVIDLTSLSKATIYRLIKSKEFPKKGIYGWSLNQIQSWTDNQYGHKEAA